MLKEAHDLEKNLQLDKNENAFRIPFVRNKGYDTRNGQELMLPQLLAQWELGQHFNETRAEM